MSPAPVKGNSAPAEGHIPEETETMANQKSSKELAKFLSYVLGRRPDEFGLIPDPEGFVKIKDLLKALNEEEGWRHVRRTGIEEIVLSIPDAPLEISEKRIRAANREHLPQIKNAEELPKLLYTCVRKKAHSHVPEKGIFPIGGFPWVILAPEKQLAERLGKRFDPSPLMLTVQVQQALDAGVHFQSFGETLYLAESLPSGTFTAPPLPKEKEEARKKKEKPEKKPVPKTPGSFYVDFADPEKKKRNLHEEKKKEIRKEKEKRMRRKQKQKMWDD